MDMISTKKFRQRGTSCGNGIEAHGMSLIRWFYSTGVAVGKFFTDTYIRKCYVSSRYSYEHKLLNAQVASRISTWLMCSKDETYLPNHFCRLIIKARFYTNSMLTKFRCSLNYIQHEVGRFWVTVPLRINQQFFLPIRNRYATSATVYIP